MAEPIGPEDDVDADRPSILWRTPSGSVRLIVDTIVDLHLVEVETSGDEESIRAAFACYDRDEAVAALDLDAETEAVRRGYGFIAGTSIGDPDDGVIGATIRGLRHERADIRSAALVVPHYTKWTEFLPEIIRMDGHDPDNDVREEAGGHRMLLEIVARLHQRTVA